MISRKNNDHRYSEVLQFRQRFWFHRAGRRRQGCVRSCLGRGSGRHAHAGRRPESLVRHPAGCTRGQGRKPAIGIIGAGGSLLAAALPTLKEAPIEKSQPAKRDAARRDADTYFNAWQKRTVLVKEQVAAESAANDAKTNRLKALRLAKEAADGEAAAASGEPPPKRPAKRRIVIKG